MGYFEFLHGPRIICLPLNISEKLHQQNVFQKLEKTETHRLHLNYNTLQYPCNTLTLQYPCTLKNNIYHSNKHGPLPFFHLDTNPVICHTLQNPCSGCNSGFYLVAVLEYTFFQLCWNTEKIS